VLQLIVTDNVLPRSLILFNLTIAAILNCETLDLTTVTRRHIPGDGILHSGGPKHLSSCTHMKFCIPYIACQSSNIYCSWPKGRVRQMQLQFISSFFKQGAVKSRHTRQFLYITSLSTRLVTPKTLVNERNGRIRCADLHTTSFRCNGDNSRTLTCQLLDVKSTHGTLLANDSLHSGLVQTHPSDISSNGFWIALRDNVYPVLLCSLLFGLYNASRSTECMVYRSSNNLRMSSSWM
jgi:hypothetical protein